MIPEEHAPIEQAIAARVGQNLRAIRKKLGYTQARLAAPEFSISYISALEHHKLRPSLNALSVLAKRLDVPLAFLLDGSLENLEEAQTAGFSPADAEPDQQMELDLLQAGVLVRQRAFQQAQDVLDPIRPDRLTMDQAYYWFFIQGQAHLGMQHYQKAVVDFRAALSQSERLLGGAWMEQARNELGKAYFHLSNVTLATEHHEHCAHAIEGKQALNPFFAREVSHNLANDAFRQGNLEKAATFFQRALESTAQSHKQRAQKYLEIGTQYKARENLGAAHAYLRRSLAIFELCEEQHLEGLVHQNLGKTLEKQHDLDGAQREYRTAIVLAQAFGDVIVSSLAHSSLAELLLKCGKTEEAEAEAQQAWHCAKSSADMQTQGQALLALAQIRNQTKDVPQADVLFEQALDLLEASHAHEPAASGYFLYANSLEQRNEVPRSLAAMKKAYEHQHQSHPTKTRASKTM